jgi:NADPH:quinone reductase-like Zn-dependent oxidoreductase
MGNATKLPPTMRALVIDRTGGADELHLDTVPTPIPVLDELIVRVVAAGVNPIDAKTRSGSGAAAAISAFPAVLIEAAAVPVAALTAWGMVVEIADVTPGERMLIHAGSGGVGHFAVQIAKAFGAYVIATGSTRNLDFLRQLGADEVIDYTSVRFDEVLSDIDSVIDLIGNVHDDTGTRSLRVLRPDGVLVNAPSGSWPTLQADAEAAGIRATGFKVAADADALDWIAQMIDDGSVRPHVDHVFELVEGPAAHRLIEEGHTRGKIVLRISDVGVSGTGA